MVSGIHFFTFPYSIGGVTGAEFDCRCRYTLIRGQSAVFNPPPGEPGDPDEIHEIRDIEIEAYRRLSEAERERHPRRYFARYWLTPDAHLETLIRAYLQGAGFDDLIANARAYAREEVMS